MIGILSLAIELYSFVVLAAVIISWVAPGSRHPAVQLVERLVEPALAPIRKVLPQAGGIDFSPMVLLLGLQLVRRLL